MSSRQCEQHVGKRRGTGSPCLSPARFWVWNGASTEDRGNLVSEQTWSCEYHLFQAITGLPGDCHHVDQVGP